MYLCVCVCVLRLACFNQGRAEKHHRCVGGACANDRWGGERVLIRIACV